MFSITAHYPLGTYRGHRPDLAPDRLPSVARLQAALLCAAGFGPRATEYEGGLGPCDADEVALRWLEENPPTDIHIPELRVSGNDAIAYRDDGTIGKSGKAKAIRKLPKQDAAVAVHGKFVWSWREPPPEPVADALRELCPDVPHLGTAESPVVLAVSEDAAEPTHEYVPGATMFTPAAGSAIDIPKAGRVAELRRAFGAERTGKVGSDRAGTDERSLSPVPPRQAIRTARYRPVGRRTADVPWAEVLLVPLDKRIAERDRVRVAVAAHRTLIKILDRQSPPILTGNYADGTRRPPNRVALQILDRDCPVNLPGQADALAVLLPSGAASAELEVLYHAVSALRTLRPVGPVADRVIAAAGAEAEVVPGDRLWHEPAPGMVRLWRTCPPAVPDTRGYPGWNFSHAALLSLGFVWQGTELLPAPPGRGAARHNRIVEAVSDASAVVLRTEPVRRSDVDDYVHKIHEDAVVRPYRATLTLGDLGGPTTIQAIGQCRHLGGGLLVPYDLPEGTVLGGEPA
ncbi:MAG TPA: type I-U CRISPR-associated protein Csb2 [Pseudonocardiaceae bacterium]